jgi:hypothetical protein
MSRIDRHREIYETWPLEVQQAVLDGRVEPGMTPDQVLVAWGEPTEVVTQSSSGDEIWVYQSGGHPGSVHVMGSTGGYPGTYPGGGYPGSTYPGGGYPSNPGIGITTGSGGTMIGGGAGMGMGGGMGMGMPGTTTIVTPPTPAEVKEVIFRKGIVHRADASGK